MRRWPSSMRCRVALDRALEVLGVDRRQRRAADVRVDGDDRLIDVTSTTRGVTRMVPSASVPLSRDR